MTLNLTQKLKSFIKDEFDIGENAIERMSKDEWHEIRERCYDISLDELLDENDNAKDDITDRCLIAESIMDIRFSQLFLPDANSDMETGVT